MNSPMKDHRHHVPWLFASWQDHAADRATSFHCDTNQIQNRNRPHHHCHDSYVPVLLFRVLIFEVSEWYKKNERTTERPRGGFCCSNSVWSSTFSSGQGTPSRRKRFTIRDTRFCVFIILRLFTDRRTKFKLGISSRSRLSSTSTGIIVKSRESDWNNSCIHRLELANFRLANNKIAQHSSITLLIWFDFGAIVRTCVRALIFEWCSCGLKWVIFLWFEWALYKRENTLHYVREIPCR